MKMKRFLFITWAVAVLFLLSGPALAGDPVEIAGSSWTTQGLLKTKIKMFGKLHSPVVLKLFFGPQNVSLDDRDLLLGEDMMVIVFEEPQEEGGITQTTYEGTYTANHKGKPKISPDFEAAEAEISEFIEGDVSVDVRKLKIKAVPKNKGGEESIKVKVALKFTATQGDTTINVTQSYKAVGTRVQ